jgi:phospholipase/carboxylesterase
MRATALICVTLLGAAFAQPMVNHLDPTAGDFLDFPLDSVKRAAFSAYQSGDYPVAARFYLEALRYDIGNSGDIYNLACCYGLLKQDSLAALYLKRAFRAGFDDVGHVKRDPDFDSVRASPVFSAVVDSAAEEAKRRAAARGSEFDVTAQTFQPCYVHLPDGYDSTKSYPLVIGLHGYGSNPEQFARVYERAGRPGFIFAVLRAPYALNAGKELGYSWTTWSESDSTVQKRSLWFSTDYVAEAAAQLAARYPTTGTWLLGFSQGCGMAYVAGIKHPSLFKGIIGFGGGLDTLNFAAADYAAAKGLKVFAAHGKEDRVVEYRYGTTTRDFLKRKGFNVTFVDFKGGHTVAEEPLKQAVKWMGVK